MSGTIKKVSIMGCGWLGLLLGERLAEAQYKVHGSTTSREKLSVLESVGIRPYLLRVGDQLEGTTGSFFDTDLLILNIPPGRRRPDVAEKYPQEIRMVIERALSEGTRRLLFVSSTSVYPNANRVVTESETMEARKGSGLALVRTEKYLKSLPNLPLCILRFAGLVGGDRKAGRFLAGKKDLSRGAAPVNMVHRNDCIAIIRQIIREEVFGEVFNVCADEHPSRKVFYRHQALKHGFEPPTFAEEATTDFKIISNEKVKKVLNYSFQYPDPMEF